MDYLDYYKDSQLLYHYNKDNPPFFHKYGMHTHDIYEILYIISGSGKMVVEDNVYTLHEQSIYLFRSNEAHYIKLNNSAVYERKGLHFYKEVVASIDPQFRLMAAFENRQIGTFNQYILDKSNQYLVEHAFESIKKQELAYDKRTAILINLLCILEEINKLYFKKENVGNDSQKVSDISKVLMYINEHLCDKITLDDLCNRFFMTNYQINTLFREATSVTVWQYIKKKRLVLAKSMIQSGIYAQEAAWRCGYTDYSAFYRAYKKAFGVSPTFEN